MYVSQDIQLHFNISLPFCQKNILSAMLVQICSTTLQSCTSSNAQIGIWSCYQHKKHANTLLQNARLIGKKIFAVLLPYEFTLLQNLKRGRKLLPVHISQGFSITFYHITFLLSEGHIDYYTCANLFNYPAILYLSKCSNRHLKLLPAQKSHKYTTPKPFTIWYSRNLLFYYPMNLHYSKTSKKGIQSCYQCMYHRTFNCILLYHFPFFRKTYWVPCLCKFVQLPCDFAPLQMFK